MPTQKMKPIHLFVPFETIERRDEDGAYIVEGYAFCNEVVGGEGGIRLKRSAMEAATPDYLKFGAIREMHQPIAAGTCLQATWDEKGCRLRAEIVDDAAIKKIERKVYKGFSVGVNPRDITADRVVEVCDWPETSLVDRPKDPDALFLHRVEGYDPDAEVEVEVLQPSSDAHPAEEEAPPAGTASPAEAPADPVSPVPPPDAGTESPLDTTDTPTEPDASGGGDLSEEKRAALAAFLAEQGLPAGLLASIDVTEQERAQSSGTVPVRENLDNLRPKTPQEVNSALSEPPRGDYRVEQAPTGAWCVYGPDGEKLGEFATRAEADARVAQAKEAMQEPSRAAGAEVPWEKVRAELLAEPAVERVIKHEDGKWCVYSESGRKLGEHDSKEDAEKQLQAIEIEKHKDEKDATQPKERAANLHLQVFHMPTGMLAGWSISDFGNHTFEHFATRKECLARLEAMTDSEAEGQPWTETVRHGIAEVAGQFAVWDAERDTFQRFDTREAAEERLAALLQVSGEQPDEATALSRLEIVTAELSRAQAAEKEALTRLAAAERKVKDLENTPARERPVKYGGPALERTFLANLGSEHDAETKRLQEEYQRARAAAEAARDAGDRDTRDREMQRMMVAQGELSLRGVLV